MLRINLTAIQDNWLKLAALAPEANVAGVIKANSYGLGAGQVGNSLYKVGCREFFVATLDEGKSARKFLPDNALIYVLGGARIGDEQAFVNARLIPVLCSVPAIVRWAEMNSASSSTFPSAIKINTGMTRLGLDIHEFNALCDNENLLRLCNPVLLMSHLACADEPQHPLNDLQLDAFAKCGERIRRLLPNLRLSLANSSGIFLGSKWHFDLVRPGAALYGIPPQASINNPLAAVVELSLPILQVRSLSEPSVIGYGAGTVLQEGSRLAVVAGGYADGLNRTVGSAPAGILHGQLIKAVGRISMDLTVFDISGIQLSDECLLQSSISVINDQLSLEYLSTNNKLLGYEVLTSLGGRYKREYIGGSCD